MTEREFALDVIRLLRDAGFEALWAGGCVRDELLGLVPRDYDVASSARPEEVRRLFRRTVAVGMSFGVVEVLGPQPHKVQVATFRSDGAYTDGRRPDTVVYSSAEADAQRRDFTINGMFFDPVEERLIDYVGGQADLRAKVLRAIGDPAARFAEDKLRTLRGVRIATRFDLSVEPATAAAIRAAASQITVVSAERIADELRNLIVHPRRAAGMRLMLDLSLVAPVLPELPTGDHWDHTLAVLDHLGPCPSFPLAFAALLHELGRRTAGQISLRLKLSNQERERIEWLVDKHKYLADARTMRMAKLKPILAHPDIEELLALHQADAAAWGKSADHVDYCRELLRTLPLEILNPQALLTGDDLLNRGLKAGPLFKRLLDAVRDAQLDGTISTQAEAWALVERLLAEWGEPPLS
jgi:poly(A) polymerase